MVENIQYRSWIMCQLFFYFKLAELLESSISWVWPAKISLDNGRGLPDVSVVKNPPVSAGDVGSILGQEGPPEEKTATHSSILAWRIPRREEPGGLQSMGLQSDTTDDWAWTQTLEGAQNRFLLNCFFLFPQILLKFLLQYFSIPFSGNSISCFCTGPFASFGSCSFGLTGLSSPALQVGCGLLGPDPGKCSVGPSLILRSLLGTIVWSENWATASLTPLQATNEILPGCAWPSHSRCCSKLKVAAASTITPSPSQHLWNPGYLQSEEVSSWRTPSPDFSPDRIIKSGLWW